MHSRVVTQALLLLAFLCSCEEGQREPSPDPDEPYSSEWFDDWQASERDLDVRVGSSIERVISRGMSPDDISTALDLFPESDRVLSPSPRRRPSDPVLQPRRVVIWAMEAQDLGHWLGGAPSLGRQIAVSFESRSAIDGRPTGSSSASQASRASYAVGYAIGPAPEFRDVAQELRASASRGSSLKPDWFDPFLSMQPLSPQRPQTSDVVTGDGLPKTLTTHRVHARGHAGSTLDLSLEAPEAWESGEPGLLNSVWIGLSASLPEGNAVLRVTPVASDPDVGSTGSATFARDMTSAPGSPYRSYSILEDGVHVLTSGQRARLVEYEAESVAMRPVEGVLMICWAKRALITFQAEARSITAETRETVRAVAKSLRIR